MSAPLTAPVAPGSPGAAPVVALPNNGGNQPVVPTPATVAANQAAAAKLGVTIPGVGSGTPAPTPPPTDPINRPVLSPYQPNAAPAAAAKPRSADDIYSDYVSQGQKTMDAINAAYDNAVRASNDAIDKPAGVAQENNNAMAAANGLLGSSAAVVGSTNIGNKAGADKASAEAGIRSQQAKDITTYLGTLQKNAQDQANFETQQFPTTDAYLKSQAGQAFNGLAAAGVDWDKFSSNPAYQGAYNSVVSAFGDPGLAKLAFIAAQQAGTKSQYLSQDPIQTADGSWIFLKQTTNPDGTTTIKPDKVDIGSSLPQGASLVTMNGKAYSVVKGADGTLTYKPVDTSASNAAGFTLGTNQTRYELNPATGKYEAVAAAGGGSGSGGGAGDAATISAWKNAVVTGNATMGQVPAGIRNAVALALADPGLDSDGNPGSGNYSPLAASRETIASNRIVTNFTQLPQYQLTANGLPYLQRIDAAMQNPGSVSDQDLLDSLTKLNTAGNAISDAQVKLITDGRSYADSIGVAANKLGNGGVLSDNQRQQIQKIAKAIYANYQKGYQPVYDQVTAQLKAAGIPKQFWTIPDLNNLTAQINGGSYGTGGSDNSGGATDDGGDGGADDPMGLGL